MASRKRKPSSSRTIPPSKARKGPRGKIVEDIEINGNEPEPVPNGESVKRSRQPAKTAKRKSLEKEPKESEATKIPTKVAVICKEKKINGPEYGSGVLAFCGGTNWDLVGRSQLPKGKAGSVGENLYGPNLLKGIRVCLAVSSSNACHSVVITDDGHAMSWGRNEKGQLGLGDTNRRDVPTLIEGFEDCGIVDAAVGRSHTLLLTDQGEVFSFGDNTMGQCGTGRKISSDVPKQISFQGPLITKVACGADFSVIVDAEGYLHAFGSPEYGQLGNNTDGQYFISASKLAFDCVLAPKRITTFLDKSGKADGVPVEEVCITSVVCGNNHTVAVDTKKRCYTWGCGGYGRLGHANTKDEMVPRQVKFFDGPQRGAGAVYAGGTFSLVVNEYGALYFWGQTKPNAEATMYPKPVMDLMGWKVRQAACLAHGIVVLADDSVVSWGNGTTGELGYGDQGPKSSTKPKVVTPLENCHVNSIACGYAHTLFVIRDESDADKDSVGKLPVFSPVS